MKLKHWIGALASLVIAGQASATVLHFTFTAVVNDVWEYDKAGETYTHLGTSNFAGSPITLGNLVHGTFSFNTDAPLSLYQPDTPASGSYKIYSLDSKAASLSFSVGSAGFTSGSTLPPLAQVANNASTLSGWDTFFFSAYKAYDPVMFQSADIALFDKTGTAFSTGTLPTALDLADFHYKQLSAAWLRQADGNQMHIEASLTSLVAIAPVPEPASYALLMVGLLAIRGVARQRKHGT